MNAPSLVLWHLKSPRVWSPRGIRDESCQPIDVVRPDTVVSLRFAASTHFSAAPRAHQIQNAGYHICTPHDCSPAH